MFTINKIDTFSLIRSHKITSLLLSFFMLSACGGSDQNQGVPVPDSGRLVITEENATDVARHAKDSAAAVIKLAVQFQEVMNAQVVSGSEHFEFDCYGSGNIVIRKESNVSVVADFDNCNNSLLEESFDGQLKFTPDAIYYNMAGEVFFEGAVDIAGDMALGGDAYSSLRGGFHISQQATWHGDRLVVKHRSAKPIILADANGDVTIDELSVDLEYDLDMRVGRSPTSSFYGGFDIALDSTELGGKYSCDTVEPFGIGDFDPVDFEIYCSGDTERALLLDRKYVNSGNEITISILDETTNQYESVWGLSWLYFSPIYSYQPGYPQSTSVTPELSAIEFSMPISDAVYSDHTKHFYIVVPSDAQDYSNHLVELDAKTGSVSRSVALKGEVGELAISGDGSILYLGYTGFSEVQRVEIDTLSLTTVLDLGLEYDTRGEPLYAMEIAVSPESDNVVAVATYTDGIYKDPAGLKYFRAGTEKVVTGGFTLNPTRLAFNDNGSRLITYSDHSSSYYVGVFSVEPAGMEFIAKRRNYASGPSDIHVLGDTLYNGVGSVMNPETGELIGNNSIMSGFGENRRKMAPLVTPDKKHTYIYAKYLEVFDKDRFTYLGEFDPALEGDFLRLFNVGDDQFAFVTDVGIKLFDHVDVPTGRDWQCDFFDLFDARMQIDIETVDCLFNDAVFSPVHKKIYASISGAAGINGNSIAVVNSESLVIEQYLPVGSEPSELEISHDQQFLYVAYTGTNKYSVIDLSTLKTVMDVDLGNEAGSVGPIFVGDLEPFPSDSTSVLISTAKRGYTTDYVGMAVYTDGIKAPAEVDGVGVEPRANRIRFVDDNVVFGYDTESTAFELSEFHVDASGVNFIEEYDYRIFGFSVEIEYSNGRLYSSLGDVVDVESRQRLGKMEGLETDNFTRHQFVVDESRGVLYLYASMLLFGNDPVLKVYSLDTFEELAAVKMPAFSVLLGAPKALINLDDDRLVVVLDNFMYRIDKNDLLQ